MKKSNKDVCNVVVSFIALEIKIDKNQKQKQKNHYFSLVFKRGSQQRNETNKFLHKLIGDGDDEISLVDNQLKY